MKKSANTLIAVLFMLAVISIAVLAVVISLKSSSGSDGYFYPDKRAAAVPLYNTIMSLSDENYPQTPDEAVSVYFSGYRLLYGGMIKDENIVTDILIQQRMLLSDELLQNNGVESQKTALEKSVGEFKEKDIVVTFVQAKAAKYEDMENACIRVTLTWSNLEDISFDYYLTKFDSKWKITKWEIASE